MRVARTALFLSAVGVAAAASVLNWRAQLEANRKLDAIAAALALRPAVPQPEPPAVRVPPPGAVPRELEKSTPPPYVIEAIGDGKRLRDRFEASRLGRDWRARADRTGLGLEVRTQADLRLRRIDEARLKVPHAEVVEVGQ